MYAYEGIVRSIIKVSGAMPLTICLEQPPTFSLSQVNYFLLIHHAMFFVLVIVEFVDQSNFVVKTCLILDYFVVWEFGLFMTNVLYRWDVRSNVEF